MFSKLSISILLFSILGLTQAAAVANYTGVTVQLNNGTNAKGSILYVFRSQWRQRDEDFKVRNHLVSTGYNVTLADQTEPASVAKGHDLIIISSTITSAAFETKYRDNVLPIFTWENDIQDDMRFTGKCKGVDFGETADDEGEHYIDLVNFPHPISANLTSGVRTIYASDQPMGFGKPGLGADIIATRPGLPDEVVIYAYEKGATMDYDFEAPARRVFFGLDNETFEELNSDGLALFDAAVAYSIGLTSTY